MGGPSRPPLWLGGVEQQLPTRVGLGLECVWRLSVQSLLRMLASWRVAGSFSNTRIFGGTPAFLWRNLLQPVPVACDWTNPLLQLQSRRIRRSFGRIASVIHCALEHDRVRARRATLFAAAAKVPFGLTASHNGHE